MAKIAIDVDDTLYSFAGLARQILANEAARTGNKQYEIAAYSPWVEWRTPVDLLGEAKWLEIIRLCHKEEQIRCQLPYEGSQELLRELGHDHELIYVSSRDDKRSDATLEWLEDNAFPSGELICSGHDKTKHLAGCQYIVDDRPSTLVRFVYDFGWKLQHGTNGPERVGFALQTEFNRSLTDVPNIYLAPPGNWKLLRKYFVKTGVLKEKKLTYA